MQTQNQLADGLVAATAVNLNQFLDRFGQFVLPGVVRLKLFIEGFIGEQARLAFVEHGQLRVQAELVEMFAHQLEAKTVERADVRGVEERDLFRPMLVEGRGSRDEGIFQRTTQPLTHFGGGGLGEGDHENFLERSGRLFRTQAMQTTLDERVRFARARAGHDQHVAARGDGLPLGRRERIVLGARGFHLAETLAIDERR